VPTSKNKGLDDLLKSLTLCFWVYIDT